MSTVKSVTEKNPFYDILKGFGIIAVVIGHCHPNRDVIRLVYGFHLAIFFFVSGLQFNDAKYSKSPFLLIANRIKSMWPGFFGYLTFFTITSNLCVRLHLLGNKEFYSFGHIVNNIFNNFTFTGGETLGGALWFVPMMLIGICVFAFIVSSSTLLFPKYKAISVCIMSCICGAWGVYCNIYKKHLFLHSQSAFILIPLLCLGYLISYYKFDMIKLLKWPIALIAFAVYFYIFAIKDYQIDLAGEQIISSYLFYPATILGIYFISYIAKLVMKLNIAKKAFSQIGIYSFDIMALHFLVFKIIDVIYGNLIGASHEIYSRFPCAYPNLWIIYLVVSLAAIPYVRILINKTFSLLINFCEKHFNN